MTILNRIDTFLEKIQNPWHDREGRFASPDDLEDGSYSKGGERMRARGRKGKKKPRKTPVMGDCGRAARRGAGNVRCHDGEIIDRVGRSRE